MEKDLHNQLFQAFQYSNRRILNKTERLGLLPGQPKILEYLLEHDGARSKEIGLGCVLDKSTVAGALPRLEQQGFIVRKEHELDKRASRIFLTDKGREAAKQVREICAEVDRTAFRGISGEEQARFTEVFRKIIENIGSPEDRKEEMK